MKRKWSALLLCCLAVVLLGVMVSCTAQKEKQKSWLEEEAAQIIFNFGDKQKGTAPNRDMILTQRQAKQAAEWLHAQDFGAPTTVYRYHHISKSEGSASIRLIRLDGTILECSMLRILEDDGTAVYLFEDQTGASFIVNQEWYDAFFVMLQGFETENAGKTQPVTVQNYLKKKPVSVMVPNARTEGDRPMNQDEMKRVIQFLSKLTYRDVPVESNENARVGHDSGAWTFYYKNGRITASIYGYGAANETQIFISDSAGGRGIYALDTAAAKEYEAIRNDLAGVEAWMEQTMVQVRAYAIDPKRAADSLLPESICILDRPQITALRRWTETQSFEKATDNYTYKTAPAEASVTVQFVHPNGKINEVGVLEIHNSVGTSVHLWQGVNARYEISIDQYNTFVKMMEANRTENQTLSDNVTVQSCLDQAPICVMMPKSGEEGYQRLTEADVHKVQTFLQEQKCLDGNATNVFSLGSIPPVLTFFYKDAFFVVGGMNGGSETTITVQSDKGEFLSYQMDVEVGGQFFDMISAFKAL